MQLRSGFWRVGVVLILVIVLAALAACGSAGGDDDSESQTLNGQALLENRCTQCHGLDKSKSLTQTEAEWQATIEDMIRRGANLNDQEKQVLVAYMAEMYGP